MVMTPKEEADFLEEVRRMNDEVRRKNRTSGFFKSASPLLAVAVAVAAIFYMKGSGESKELLHSMSSVEDVEKWVNAAKYEFDHSDFDWFLDTRSSRVNKLFAEESPREWRCGVLRPFAMKENGFDLFPECSNQGVRSAFPNDVPIASAEMSACKECKRRTEHAPIKRFVECMCDYGYEFDRGECAARGYEKDATLAVECKLE